MAYIAEVVFGVADITGAFIAGLIISNTNKIDVLCELSLIRFSLYVVVAGILCKYWIES